MGNWIKPLHFKNQSFANGIVETAERMLYLGRSYYKIEKSKNGQLSAKLQHNNESTAKHVFKTAGKIAFYFLTIGLGPLICLSIKITYRSTHHINLNKTGNKPINPRQEAIRPGTPVSSQDNKPGPNFPKTNQKTDEFPNEKKNDTLMTPNPVSDSSSRRVENSINLPSSIIAPLVQNAVDLPKPVSVEKVFFGLNLDQELNLLPIEDFNLKLDETKVKINKNSFKFDENAKFYESVYDEGILNPNFVICGKEQTVELTKDEISSINKNLVALADINKDIKNKFADNHLNAMSLINVLIYVINPTNFEKHTKADSFLQKKRFALETYYKKPFHPADRKPPLDTLNSPPIGATMALKIDPTLCLATTGLAGGGTNASSKIIVHFEEFKSWKDFAISFTANAELFVDNYYRASENEMLDVYLQSMGEYLHSFPYCLQGKIDACLVSASKMLSSVLTLDEICRMNGLNVFLDKFDSFDKVVDDEEFLKWCHEVEKKYKQYSVNSGAVDFNKNILADHISKIF